VQLVQPALRCRAAALIGSFAFAFALYFQQSRALSPSVVSASDLASSI